MEILSSETQLRLSHRSVSRTRPTHELTGRRNWFLERLLKLGSIDVKKAYQCVSALCLHTAELVSERIARIPLDVKSWSTINGIKQILLYAVMVLRNLLSLLDVSGNSRLHLLIRAWLCLIHYVRLLRNHG